MDHLFEVFGAMAARVSALQPKAGVSVLAAKPECREGGRACSAGAEPPFARLRGEEGPDAIA